jgi:hypothetical protein
MTLHTSFRPTVAACLSAIVSVGLFCLGSQSLAAASDAGGFPPWLQEAMAKELPKVRYVRVKAGDGYFRSRIAGKLTDKPASLEGGWYMTSNIGTESPLECWVLNEPVDPATLAANIAESTMQRNAEVHGELDNRSIYFIDAGSYDGAPYLALEWLFTVGEAPDAMVGLTKVRVAVKGDSTLACGHNNPGYRQTFAAAFEKFVRAADIESAAPQAYYEEVIVQKVGTQPIGFAHTTFTLDQDGDTEIRSMESSMIPVDASTLSTSDSRSTAFAYPDGALINQSSATSENGELTMMLSLAPAENGGWQISGTYQGKELSSEIPTDVQPMTELGQMKAVRQLLDAGGMTDISMDVWVPQADPTQFLRAGVTLSGDEQAPGSATLTMGPMSVAARFDPNGSMMTGHMQVGAVDMHLERVWADGTLP